jgi:transcriptional regulator with XRE-family HTH domain
MKLAQAIAQRIKELREAAGLSQQEVAMRADLSLSLVAKIEQGKKGDPRASTLLALAQALGVPPGQLLEGLPVPPRQPATVAAIGDDADPPPQRKKRKKKKPKAKAKQAKAKRRR